MDENYKVLYLTSNEASLGLAEWIAKSCKVEVIQEKITLEKIKIINPDILISYNYSKIVAHDVLEYMNGKSINLHISFLPWNKGADPSYWSFVEDTPKGVTIHQMVPGLDAGSIIYQRECEFDTSVETFETAYQKLQDTIQNLFKEHWDEIKEFNYELKPQSEGGSYHKHSQLVEIREKVPFEWKDIINEYKKRYKEYKETRG